MLYNVFKHPSYYYALATQASNCTRSWHYSGNIWKHFIYASIHRDLAGIAVTNCDNCDDSLRRFVRLEHIGLSGVILYEIRMCSPCCLLQGNRIGAGEYLTMRRVFGDPDSSASMNLDNLLDMVDAKVIHFPTYACTSFIVSIIHVVAELVNLLED
jgi:hypothetical protein